MAAAAEHSKDELLTGLVHTGEQARAVMSQIIFEPTQYPELKRFF
jgi:hypothetical protein